MVKSYILFITGPPMPENIPGMKEIKGLIKVDIINSN